MINDAAKPLEPPAFESEAYQAAYDLGCKAIATVEKAKTIPQLDSWLGKNATVLNRLPKDIMDAVRHAASKHRVKLEGGKWPIS